MYIYDYHFRKHETLMVPLYCSPAHQLLINIKTCTLSFVISLFWLFITSNNCIIFRGQCSKYIYSRSIVRMQCSACMRVISESRGEEFFLSSLRNLSIAEIYFSPSFFPSFILTYFCFQVILRWAVFLLWIIYTYSFKGIF